MKKILSNASRCLSPPRSAAPAGVFEWIVVIGLALLIAGCVPPQRRAPDWQPDPPRTPPPRSACAPGVNVIGTLAVISNTLFRNRAPARSGERVCNGDHISTDATGVGDLLLDGDSTSDSIHFSENTDPSITVTPNGCVTVDAYRSGRVVATARRRCMVLRTPDTLLLLVGGSVQVVVRNTTTEVVPLRGTLYKLIDFPPQKVNVMPQAELSKFTAETNLQPQPQSLNIYSRNKLTGPATRLSPSQIQQIDRSVIRRPLPVAPDQQIR